MAIIWHGSYGMETDFEVRQIVYAGSHCEARRQGFVELLVIENPPRRKHPVVLHVYYDGQWLIHNFRTIKQARQAFNHGFWRTFLGEKPLSQFSSWRNIRSFPGFISTQRFQNGNPPWFIKPTPPDESEPKPETPAAPA